MISHTLAIGRRPCGGPLVHRIAAAMPWAPLALTLPLQRNDCAALLIEE